MICVIIVQNSSITHSHSFYISPLLSFVIYRPLQNPHYITLPFFWLFLALVFDGSCTRSLFPYRKDARLPVQLQRAMAAEAEAAREARAKVQSHLLCPKRIGCKLFPFFFRSLGYSCRRWTEGFAGSTGSLRGHRRILVRSAIEIPSGKSWTSQKKSSHSYWYFCSLQTLNSISAEKNSTIIFPLPIDLLSHFMNGNGSSNGQSKAKQGKKSDWVIPLPWAWAGPPYPAHP